MANANPTSSAHALMEAFSDAFDTDDESFEKKGSRFLRVYEAANKKDQELINDLFITLCGWSFATLKRATTVTQDPIHPSEVVYDDIV